MKKGSDELKAKLRNYRFKFGTLQKVPCSEEENKLYTKKLQNGGSLPHGIYAYISDLTGDPTGEFYTVQEPDLTEQEINEYLTYKKLSILNTIKNCVLFFTILTIIGLVLSILMSL